VCGVHDIPMDYSDTRLGIKKFASTLKSFDIEFQPFIEEINTKEGVIREFADAATMERIRSMAPHVVLVNKAKSNANIQISKEFFRILRQT